MPSNFKNINEFRQYQRNSAELERLAKYFAGLKTEKDNGRFPLNVGSDPNYDWQPSDMASLGFQGADPNEIMSRANESIDQWGGVFSDLDTVSIYTTLQR